MSEVTYRITPLQNKVLKNFTEKYNAVAKGRRWGITILLMIFCFRKLIEKKTAILWGDTVHGNIDRYFQRYMLPLLIQMPPGSWNFNAQRKELRIINSETSDYTTDKASIMDFRSADTPETWEGFGYNFIVLNEAGIILKSTYLYKNAILPMLLDFPDSQLIAIGVPKGKTIKNGDEHPFYSICKNGIAGKKGYSFQQYSSYDSAVALKADIDNLVEELGGHNHPIVRQEIYGEFIDAVDMPFLHAFNENEHVGDVEYNKFLPVYLCWDFNVKSTCLVIQFDEDQISVLQEYHQAGIPGICAEAVQEFKPRDIYINGDASGANDNASNETYYQIVREALDLSYQNGFRVPRSNPRHKASYLACNHILKHTKVKIHPQCKGLIRDCNLVQIIQQKGKIEIDKSDQLLTHFIDPFRYHIHAEHLHRITINLEE